MTVVSPKGPHVAWPSWRYGPNGESEIFKSAADVPDGWKDHPRKHKPGYVPEPAIDSETGEPVVAAAPAKPARTYPISRDEMCAGLFQRHIPFEDEASDEALWALVQATQAMTDAAEKAAEELIAGAHKELDAREAAIAEAATASKKDKK